VSLDVPVIVVDTREQVPWEFSSRVATVRRALPAGDYSLDGYEQRITVERKSLADYIRSVIQQRERFGRELRTLAGYDFAAVVVEAAWPDVVGGRYAGGVKPASVVGATVSIMVDIGVPVLFAGDRPGARRMTEELLLRWLRRHGDQR
jgi:DNA excision repair protein ERCC-4